MSDEDHIGQTMKINLRTGEYNVPSELPSSTGSEDVQEDTLRVVMDGGEIQIWYENFMILGSGQTMEEAQSAVVHTLADIEHQLTHLRPPNDQAKPRGQEYERTKTRSGKP